jgi:hypothetical protein
MNSLEILTTDAVGSVAHGAAQEDHGYDEQRELEEHHETGSSSEGRHRVRLLCPTLLAIL